MLMYDKPVEIHMEYEVKLLRFYVQVTKQKENYTTKEIGI